jgi:hypothetical protein
MKTIAKRFAGFSFFVVLFALPLAAQPIHLLGRQHYDVTVNGHTTAQMTELMFTRGDHQDGFITLLSDAQGRHYIFTFSENYAEKRTLIEVKDVARNLFLRGSFSLSYRSSTIAGARKEITALPRESFRVPMTIETNAYSDTELVDSWHLNDAASKRSLLRNHVDGKLLGAIRSMGGGVLAAGSPAVMYACDYLISVVAEDLSCNRRLGVEAVEKETDCAFDATFGYPCPSH